MSNSLRHTFVTSDHHFGSMFSSPDKENDLILRWNSVVKPNDIVLYNGDFCDCCVLDLCNYAKQLNGMITLIKGNHDRLPNEVYNAVFSSVTDEICMPDFNLIIHHKPRTTSYNQIYGHLHRGEIIGPLSTDHNFCSCVQGNDGYPVSLERVLLSFK